MDVIEKMLRDVPLPTMAAVRQKFDGTTLDDVAGAVAAQIAKPEIAGLVTPGMRIAVGVGSRGLARLPDLVRATVTALRDLGAEPFIVPAMGSHGGASAIGQTALLGKLGVTEQSAGCPIRATMDTVELGRLPSGLPVLMDALAMEADGIVVINRVKPHTSFSAPVESGLAKMLTIGLGKHAGAESCHSQGFVTMGENVAEMARIKIAKAPILGICLGHQIIGLALGGDTYKLKFGHRGANQPVMDLGTDKVEITTQNHGFSVDAERLPKDLEVTHLNLNDDT
ncbi:hypothetical protein LCGC14_2643330, partial [marine sediment metagenome]